MRLLGMPRWSLATALVKQAARGRVVSGPFKGMSLSLSPVSSRRLLGYVLGTQELELSEVIEEICRRHYRTILNVGAADGYYAVGLTLRSPASRIVAFEMLPEFHRVIETGARKNNVWGRIWLYGACGSDDLSRELEQSLGPALIFMDIEGAEVELLDPEAVPGLTRADILVETHDPFVPGCTAGIVARFEATHAIRQYTTSPRALSDFPPAFLPLLARTFPTTALELMDERRPGTQHWLFMTSKRRGRRAGEIRL
jgi:hypothetical protein